MSRRLVVLDVVGLTPRLLAHMPRLRAVAERGFRAELGTVLPAVTCSVQSTFLTGEPPSGHGIVGNGWYFRDLGDVLLWRQHNALVGGEKLWQAARRAEPGYTVANVCWWYAMGADVDWTVTPRPVYYADGRKEPDCYTDPPQLHDALTGRLGTFPLFSYWGPGAGLASSAWICRAAEQILADHSPDLTLVYVPHLDYDLQRYGPSSPRAAAAAAELDGVLGPLLDAAEARDATVVALSEYGITDASRPVDVNRLLRAEGLLRVHTQAGMEYLDPWTSRAFAVADHQVAHVYVRDPADVPAVAKLCAGLPGVAEVLDAEGKAAHGLDHPRAGELVLVAEPDAWFTYYYWLDDARAPDFARLVEIHRKPGYDPAELFFDPAAPAAAKRRAAVALARKKLGMRYLMNVVGLDAGARAVRGSHGRLPAHPADGPVLLCSDRSAARERIAATEVKGLLLELAGLTASGTRGGGAVTVTVAPTDASGLRARFDAELAAFLERQGPDWPDGAPRGVFTALQRFVLAGGKRLRPLFCYWGWRGAGGEDGTPIVVASAALELFHAFALIHDDILDGSDRRRGEPSVHRLFADLHARSSWRGDPEAYGRNTALLCGDLCAAWSDQMFHECGLTTEQVHRGYAMFALMRTEVIAGEYLDLVSGVGDGSVASALTVIRMKAARYTVTRPLQIGATLAGGPPELVDALAEFGDPLGDAFQLRDDVLGVFGDPAVTGKSILDDLREGKPTVMMALARSAADRVQTARLRELFGNPDLDADGAAELRAIIEATGARDRIEQMIRVRTDAALAALERAPVGDETRAALVELAGLAIDRRS